MPISLLTFIILFEYILGPNMKQNTPKIMDEIKDYALFLFQVVVLIALLIVPSLIGQEIIIHYRLT